MIEYATHQFRLARKKPDGGTEKEHLESARRQLANLPAGLVDMGDAKPPPETDEPHCPPDGEHIWAWFLTLHQSRGGNGFGGNPISYGEIQAWCLLTGTCVRPAELAAILAIDHAWLAAQSEPEPLTTKVTPGKKFPEPYSSR